MTSLFPFSESHALARGRADSGTIASNSIAHRGQMSARAPALPVAIALAAGITFDRVFVPPLVWEWLLTLLLVASWTILFRNQRWRWSTCVLIASIGSLGATWHHARWATVRGNDVSAYATDEPAPVRLVATLRDDPAIVPKPAEEIPSAIPQYDRSLCTLSV